MNKIEKRTDRALANNKDDVDHLQSPYPNYHPARVSRSNGFIVSPLIRQIHAWQTRVNLN
jgi:hypothetical protein